MALSLSRPVVLDRVASHRHTPIPRRPRATSARASPARVWEPSPRPLAVVLTARPLIAARPDIVEALRAVRYSVRTVPSWQRLLDEVEAHPVDAALVDLDAVEQDKCGLRLAMSSHRLASLLARRARAYGFALVLQTALDYIEIEDLVRQGVQALARLDDPSDRLVASIQTAVRRVAARRGLDRARLVEGTPPTYADSQLTRW
jgi:DNA-binding NarL/FixJ family response regulator